MTLRSSQYLLPLLLFSLVPASQAQSVRPPPAESIPLQESHTAIRQQPLSSGQVTGSVDIAVPLGETPVTIRSVAPAGAQGQYRISFTALDLDADGYISRDEAQANASLADEFESLDVKRRGRLDRVDLAGWLVD